MITLILARGDNYETVPLALPATPDKADEAFAMLDTVSRYAGEIRIANVDSNIPNLAQYIKNTDMNDPDALSKLNQLAKKINSMRQQKRYIFSGVLDAERIYGLDDVLRIADSLNDYELVEDVTSDRALGGWLVKNGRLQFPEYMFPYLDYVAIGREYYSNHGGAYTLHGYVKRRADAQEQMEQGAPVFQLHLTCGQRECRLDLPADESQLDTVKKNLCVEDFAQAHIYRVKCSMAYLYDLLPMDCISVEDANELALAVQEMRHTDGELLKYLSVLSIEKPENFPAALNLALNLDDYERVPDDQEEYGKHVLRRFGVNEAALDILEFYTDFEQLGETYMEGDDVQQTEFGSVRRISTPFSDQTQSQQSM